MPRDEIPARETAVSIAKRAREGTVSLDEVATLCQDPRVSVRHIAARLSRRRRAAEKESLRLDGMLTYECDLWAQGLVRIAGVDEAGAGPLAGPVVAAAVVLAPGSRIERVNDSKMLSPESRQALAGVIKAEATAYAVASCSVEEIDRMNILQASREAMRRAVLGLCVAVDHVLVDTRRVPHIEVPQTSIVKGDQKSLSIAAASIIAKVSRDGLMRQLAEAYPDYGFEQHKGYGTKAHLAALRKLGPCPLHRRSFGPVKRLIKGSEAAATAPDRRNRSRRAEPSIVDDRQGALPFPW